jgi:magnesium transporter
MPNFQKTREYVTNLKLLIENSDREGVRELLADLFAVDIADIIDSMEPDEARFVMEVLDNEKAVEILVEMEEEVRERFLNAYTPEEIATRFVPQMDSDDAVDIINQLPNRVKDEIIAHLKDVEVASNIVSLLHYDENSAGGLMAKELIKANINWNISQCIEEIRQQAENVENIHTVYVVDEQDRLKGIISIKSLILSKPGSRVSDIYSKEVVYVNTHSSAEDVSSLMSKYDLVAIPVVDALGRLVGRITIDDVVDVMQEEAQKDYQLMSGISESVESTDKVWILSRARLPWLLIGLLGGIANSRVIGNFDHDLVIHPEMIFFMPLVAAMGGNAGVQSSAIMVQGLANDTLGTKDILPKISKEFMVAFLNGFLCAAIIMAYNVIIKQEMNLSLTVSFALLSVIIFASILGTVVPLLLDKIKIDPALATGPFITTTNDLLGLGLYFAIGRYMLV